MGERVDRDQLMKKVEEGQFIPGIYNYCDRWCERCPQTSRCLNYSISKEEFTDSESQDIRNEAFWKKLSDLLAETMELLRESAAKWGIDLETLDSPEQWERTRQQETAAENHLLCRAAKGYSEMVEDWFSKRTFLFEAAAAAREGVDLDEAVEVIRWYQNFIYAKVMRAVRGKVEEEAGGEEFRGDADGSAKISLIAIDRSIAAWATIRHYVEDEEQEVLEILLFLDRLRQAVEKAFPDARSFVRPGLDCPVDS